MSRSTSPAAAAAAAPASEYLGIPSSYSSTGIVYGMDKKTQREFKRTRVLLTFNTNATVRDAEMAEMYGNMLNDMAYSLFGGSDDQQRTNNFSRFVRVVLPFKDGTAPAELMVPCREDDEEYMKPVRGAPQLHPDPDKFDTGYRGSGQVSNRGFLFGIDPDHCRIDPDNTRLFTIKSRAEIGTNARGRRLHLHVSILVIHRGHIRFLRNKIQNKANEWCAAQHDNFPFRIEHFDISVGRMSPDEYLFWIGNANTTEMEAKAPNWVLNPKTDEWEEKKS